jgi:molybdopterin-containing oxidoreductase family iron-sulfur binding subunit
MGSVCPQQLAFADARAKLADAPRFVYIGPRRSLTGLNADEWIACKPGSELAIVNALAGRGGSIADAATASGVDQAVLQQLANELSATKPSLVLSGATTTNALDVALAVNALNQAAGNVGVTIKPAEASSRSIARARPTSSATLSSAWPAAPSRSRCSAG